MTALPSVYLKGLPFPAAAPPLTEGTTNIQEYHMLDNLNPKYRKWLIWGGSLGLVISTIAVLSPSSPDRKIKKDEEIKHVFTDFDTRKVGVDSLAANIKILYSANNELGREISSLKHQLELLQKNAGLLRINGEDYSPNDDLLREIRSLKEEITLIKSVLPGEFRNFQKNRISGKVQNTGINRDIKLPVSGFYDSDTKGEDDAKSKESLKENRDYSGKSRTEGSGGLHITAVTENSTATSNKTSGKMSDIKWTEAESAPAKPRIKNIADNSNTGKTGKTAGFKDNRSRGTGKGNNNLGYYIPAGSILSGTLLTGIDAPTREDAKEDPFPVLINIDKEAILPNNLRFDFRECFIIAAGYGDMSSERVYLRTESVNCVAESGRVIEASMSGYVAGEDGKAGIRGRLVSKQGRLIARSLTAGFLEGLAGAFNVTPVPVINTTSHGESIDYQNVYSNKALQGAAVSGSSKALERVASFYLKLAGEMFPVLEIDAARRVDIVMTSGLSLDYSLND